MNKKSLSALLAILLSLSVSSCGEGSSVAVSTSTSSSSSVSSSSININLEYIYQQAVSQGYTGTYADWIAILKGNKGSDGTSVLTGEGIPSNTSGIDGDSYIDTITWDFYLKVSGAWVKKGNIKGEDYYSANPQGLRYYPLDDGSFAVGGGESKYLSDVIIPSVYHSGNVVKIVDGAFDGFDIKSITIPSTVTSIGKEAFKDCAKLSSVIYGEAKQNVFTFNGYTSLFGNVESIGLNAFENTKLPHVEGTDGDTGANAELTFTGMKDISTSLDYSFALNTYTDISSNGTINITSDSFTEEVDMKTYGLFKNLNFKLKKDDTVVASIKDAQMGITAPEYNFAPLNGTYPVLVFSLKINDITSNGTIPTFVYLERYKAFNWAKLPTNVSYLPNVSKAAATEQDNFHFLRSYMASYIKELYDLNNSSKFNLYCVDNYVEMIPQMLIGNHIPESNWTATLLSDGSGTAYYLSSCFAVDNPSTKLTEMETSWASVKDYIFKNGYDASYIRKNLAYSIDSDFSYMVYYPYVLRKAQSNVNWWVNRLRTGENLSAITAKDSTFASDIVSSATSFYTNNLLKALTAEQAAAFKELYHFSDEMFSAATTANKKVMVILGTAWTTESSTFYNYLKMTMMYYGTDYMYYYKGHPGYATASYPDRKTQLDKLNNEGYTITELDASIAAEVILFFNPGIYACGWTTTTYESVESEPMACALYGVTLANKGTYTYGDMMDMFYTQLDSSSDYFSNTSIGLDSTKSYYLIEFNNSSAYTDQTDRYNLHEIAFYDITAGTIAYYKLVSGSTYKKVNKDGSDL
jgi:hypothetical protein